MVVYVIIILHILHCLMMDFGCVDKIVKTTISFVPSVHLSVCTEQLSSHWKDFHDILYIWVFFKNLSRIFKFHYNLTRIMSISHEEKHTFVSYLAQFFLEWEIFQTKILEKIRTFNLCSVTPPQNHTVYEIRWKNMVQLDRSQMTI